MHGYLILKREDLENESLNGNLQMFISQSTKDRVIAVAEKFLRVYWNEENNRYLNPAYPPDIYYDEEDQRFNVEFNTGFPEVGTIIVLDKTAEHGNIELQGAITLDDPPIKNRLVEHCKLYDYGEFVELMHRYGMDYDSRKDR
ncbi:hypothetical protein JIN85_17915 [Luteolibacter pohnpeiensis]|uniref:Uncharacterized protein n=1 Tax=Luteolibacter pohnpeiensis TaxID=454153 RepID=A0A934VSH2_9BACT|nr:hypothetical protein [Luteolibacter pohnpeiensis]MBK1884301.1 hypothetical protein [Luteolibacter pohnpeiensis]